MIIMRGHGDIKTHLIPQIKKDLAQIPPEQRDAKFRMALMKDYPELMEAWSDWTLAHLKTRLDHDPGFIVYVKQADPKLLQYAIDQADDMHEINLDHFNTPKYQHVLSKLFQKHPEWIQMLDNPSQDLVNQVLPQLKNNTRVLAQLLRGFHTKLPDTVQVQIVTWHPELIKWVDAPSYQVQKAAVYENPDVFDLIPVKLRDPRIKQFMKYYRAEFKKEMAQINKELGT
jgi:hypothetical protein